MKYFGGCAYCGEGGALQVDHFVPLAAGGKFEAANVIPLCETCNKVKHDKLPEQWLANKPDVLKKIRDYLNSL